MKFAVRAAAALLLAAAARGADSGDVLAPGALGASWTPLVAALAAKAPVEASFTEFRHFPFRTKPMVLKGVLRIFAREGLRASVVPRTPSPTS